MIDANKVTELNKMFHVEEVISTDHLNGTETKKVHEVKIRNNTILLRSKFLLD